MGFLSIVLTVLSILMVVHIVHGDVSGEYSTKCKTEFGKGYKYNRGQYAAFWQMGCINDKTGEIRVINRF